MHNRVQFAALLVIAFSSLATPSTAREGSCNRAEDAAGVGAAKDAAADGGSPLSLLQAAAGPHPAAPKASSPVAGPAPSSATGAPDPNVEPSNFDIGVVGMGKVDPSGKWQLYQELLQNDDGSSFGALQVVLLTVIILVSAFALYLLFCSAGSSSEDDAKAEASAGGSRLLPFLSDRPPPAQQLLSTRQMYPAMSTNQSQRPTLGQASAIHSLAPLQAGNPMSSSALRTSTSGRPSGDFRYAELPLIYPALVIPAAHTRLAVPLTPLFHRQFEMDVLALSGTPLLSASLVEGPDHSRSIQISLNRPASTLVAVVSSDKEIFGAEGTNFGTLVKEEKGGETAQHTLRDRSGRPILAVSGTHRDRGNYKMTSISGGRVIERATAVRRPAGKLPAEHYEVVANPNVDAVLVLACFLAVIVFENPSVPSSRPSTAAAVPNPKSDASSLVGRFWGYRE